MLSDAGRQYNTAKAVNPFDTMQRFKYYQLDPVKSHRKQAKPYQTLETNPRERHDSYLLRFAKEIVTCTNHSPNHSLVETTQRSQKMAKAKFERIIGDVRDEDFSVPLNKNCNHRCAKANNMSFDNFQTNLSSNNQTNQSFMKDSELETSIIYKNEMNNPQNRIYKSLNLKKNLSNSIKSTEPSLAKKKSSATLDIEFTQDQRIKPRRIRGVKFQSSAGHQYSKELDDRLAKEKIPEFYDLQNSKESLIRKSFKEPRINVNFGSFKKCIATRYDRADPEWHLRMDTSNQKIQAKDLSYDFKNYSGRKMNEVKNKYAHRTNMNLYMFPATTAKIPEL